MIPKSLLDPTLYRSRLSLQEMSQYKIITMLCNNDLLLELILRCGCDFSTTLQFRSCVRKGKKWKAVEAMAEKLLSRICNSSLLKRKILELLWPVSYRILLWKYTYTPCMNIYFLQHFYWTDGLRIDNVRTIRCIIRNKYVPVRKRFVLACSVCLSQEIQEIWTEMSNESKDYFHDDNSKAISPLLQIWARIMKGSLNIDELTIAKALDNAIVLGFLEPIKYLLSIISEDEKKEMVICCSEGLITKLKEWNFLEEDHNDIGCFLFLEMSKESQEEMLKNSSSLLLSVLLHLSEYELILNFLVDKLHSISESDFASLLQLIFYTYYLEVVNDGDYRKLFIDVWRMIPPSMRKNISESDLGAEFQALLIRDHFPFLLKEGASKKIPELTSTDLKWSISVKETDFHQEKWKLLLFLIEEELTEFSVLENYKLFILFIMKKRESNETAWNMFLRFVKKFEVKNHRKNKDVTINNFQVSSTCM